MNLWLQCCHAVPSGLQEGGKELAGTMKEVRLAAALKDLVDCCCPLLLRKACCLMLNLLSTSVLHGCCR